MKCPSTIEEARKIQRELRLKVKILPFNKTPRFVAGVDAAFTDTKVVAAACLYTFPELTPVEDALSVEDIRFPYIPGLLSFREGPAIIKAVQKLRKKPDLILFDGQGIAHPLGMGIASHVGVLLNMPTIGCAKSRLVGEYKEPGKSRGSASVLFFHNEPVGSVLRTRENVKPLFVSPGHLIDRKGSVSIVLHCIGKYRLPEPVRRADALSKKGKILRG